MPLRYSKKVVSIRPFEAHSYRDLGLALSAKKEYQKSIETLYTIIRDSKLNVTAEPTDTRWRDE